MPTVEGPPGPGVGAGGGAEPVGRLASLGLAYVKRFYSIHVTRQIWNVLGSFSSYESVHLCSLTHIKKFKTKKSLARIIYECKVEICGNFILTLKASHT